MSLKEKLNEDLKQAMRDKEVVKRDSIRAINTMIKQVEVDERRVLDDAEIIKLVQRGIKQREEAISQYRAIKYASGNLSPPRKATKGLPNKITKVITNEPKRVSSFNICFIAFVVAFVAILGNSAPLMLDTNICGMEKIL